MDKEIEKAIEIFKNGGIVVFPTDTAFGIGCRIDNEKAVKRLFKIRRRPKTKAVPVLFSSVDMVRKYVREVSHDVERLMEKYWPGALTIILHCNKVTVPSLVRGGGETLGVRIPNNKIIQTIIAKVGSPILGPSANFSDGKTPYSFKELDKKLVDLVDFIIGGETSSGGRASTIIDCTVKPWKILRQGAVKLN